MPPRDVGSNWRHIEGTTLIKLSSALLVPESRKIYIKAYGKIQVYSGFKSYHIRFTDGWNLFPFLGVGSSFPENESRRASPVQEQLFLGLAGRLA